jgi:hypothetical protein
MYGKSHKTKKTYANPHVKNTKSPDTKRLESEIAKGLPKRTALSIATRGKR